MLYLQYGSLELTGVILAYLGKLENPSIIYRLLSQNCSVNISMVVPFTIKETA
jgi:hypothetical protein